MRLFIKIFLSIYLVIFVSFNFAEAVKNIVDRIELLITFDEVGILVIDFSINSKIEKVIIEKVCIYKEVLWII